MRLKRAKLARFTLVSVLWAVCLLVTVYFHFVLRTEVIVSHLYYLPIIIAAIWWGRWAVPLAVASGAFLLLSHYFASLGSFTGDISRSCVFVLVSLTVAWLSERITQAAREARESGQHYRLLADNVTDVICILDMNLRFTYVSPSVTRMLGYSVDEMMTQTLQELLTPGSFGLVTKTLAEELATEDMTQNDLGRSRILELELTRKDGSTVWAEVHVNFLRDPEGRATGIIGVTRDVTDRKRAEAALRERMKELRCLYEIGRIVELSPESSVEEVLERIVNMLPGSWQYPEITGARITLDGSEYTTANWQPTRWYQAADIRVHGEVCGAVQVCYLEERPELDDGPFLKEERELIHAVAERLGGIIEYKQAEEALHESERKNRTLVENLPQKIFFKDKNSVYISCNENLARDLMIRPDEIAGKTDFDFVPKQLAEKYRADDKRIMQSKKMEDIEEKYIQDGQEVFIHTVKTPVKDENGNVVGLLGIFWDITEQKQAEAALQAAYQRNETVLATSMDGFLTMRLDGTIGDCNEVFCQMVGYSRDELLGMEITALETVECYEETAQHIQQVIEKGSDRFETAHRHKDGSIVDLEISVTLVETSDESFFVCFARDITETKRLWDELNHQLVRDTLTGVYNRRYFNETIIQEMKRADRYRHHTSFIMGDVDNLKAINDNFGHLVGDQMLQGIAGVLERSVRAADMVIRYGGDEFLVVMPETSEDEAHQAVSRIENNLADWLAEQVEIGVLQPDMPAQVGFSLGVASCAPGEEVAVEELLARADEVMYRVKQAKRRVRAGS